MRCNNKRIFDHLALQNMLVLFLTMRNN